MEEGSGMHFLQEHSFVTGLFPLFPTSFGEKGLELNFDPLEFSFQVAFNNSQANVLSQNNNPTPSPDENIDIGQFCKTI